MILNIHQLAVFDRLKKSKNGYLNFLRYLLIVGLSCLVIILGYYFCLNISGYLVKVGKTQGFDASTGVIGDTIGGTLSSVIGFIAAFLTFLAFYIQYQANQQQKIDLQLERFENKFFELLKLHKENVNEMSIDGYDTAISTKTSFSKKTGEEILERTEELVNKTISGRKIFVTAFYELKACHEICKHRLNFEDIPNKELYLLKMSYILIFSGIGSNAIRNVDKSLPNDSEYVETCKLALKAARAKHVETNGKENVYTIPGSNNKVNIFVKYKPFSGHATRFGHYYRHLFYMVKYVVGQSEEILSNVQKREYLRMLRAQLSGYEQLMLYFNYLSGYGSKWEDDSNKFFSTYRMIHNMPLELTDFTISARETFKVQIKTIESEGESMFEYDE